MTDTTTDTILPQTSPEHLEPEHFEQASLTTRIASLIGVIVPFAGFIAAIVLLWGRGFGWLECSLLLSMYVVTAVGVTVGYHRYFCHRSFQTHRAVQCALAIMGSMAWEGPMLKWVAMHRCHHQHSDSESDPHSPHQHGEGVLAVLQGMWHAHVGWIFRGDPKNLYRYVPDLSGDRLLEAISRTWLLWSFIGSVIPAIVAGLITMSWMGAFMGFMWGGLARIFLVHHVTWSINSVCHIWGTRPFKSHDHSRNNFLFGVVGLGEGWHNNHHAFPTSARHGLRWWELDVSYLIIRGLALVGLAWSIKVPTSDRVSAQMA